MRSLPAGQGVEQWDLIGVVSFGPRLNMLPDSFYKRFEILDFRSLGFVVQKEFLVSTQESIVTSSGFLTRLNPSPHEKRLKELEKCFVISIQLKYKISNIHI